jgi:hypothetical protein
MFGWDALIFAIKSSTLCALMLPRVLTLIQS